MPGIFFLAPGAVFADPHTQLVHTNSTITASGSAVVTGYGTTEVTLFINVKAAPTGTLPTLQYTLQEVDPGDDTTVIGPTVSSTSITAAGIQKISLITAFGGSIKISWVIGGTTPSFTQVYATMVGKDGSVALVDSAGAAISSGNPLQVYIAGGGGSGGTSSNFGAAFPTQGTAGGWYDGTNMQGARVFDADSGAGTQYVAGVVLRKSSSGGSVEAGTATDPLRTDPTGTTTQPVSGTVTANQGTGAAAGAPWSVELSDGATFYTGAKTGQFPSALVGGRLDTNLGAWLGSTAPTVGSKTSANSVPVVIASDQSAVPISAASLPLPSGAATEATLLTRLADATFTARINTLGQKTMANSTPVVISSDQTVIPVSQSGTWTVQQGTPPWSVSQSGSPWGVQTEVQLDYDTGVGTQNLSIIGLALPASGGAVAGGTATNPLRTDPTGTTTQPVSGTVTSNQGTAAGAGAPWSVRLSDGAAFYDGTKTGQLPAALVGGRLDENVGAWLGSTAPTVGQKAMTASIPVALASDQSTLPVSVASLPLPSGAATEATLLLVQAKTDNLDVALSTRLADATFTARINTLGQKAMAASTPVVLASDQTVIPVSDNGGSITVDTPQLPAALVGGRLDENVGAWLGSTAPTVGQKAMAASVPMVIASDQSRLPVATEVQIDYDTGVGTQNLSLVGLALPASGGAVAGGTATNPVRTDPTGTTTQPVSGTVTANQGTAAALAGRWPVIVTDGTNTLPTMDVAARSAFVRWTDGTNTAAVKAASTAAVAADPAGVVALSPNSPLPAGTNTLGKVDQGVAAALAGGWPVKVTDGTNTMPTGDVVARAIFEKITDGTNTAAVKAASTAAVAADPSLVVALSPNSPVPTGSNTIGAVTGTAADNSTNSTLKLPVLPARANAAAPAWTEGNQAPLSVLLAGQLRTDNTSWLGSTAPTVGQKAMAASVPVVLASDQTSINTKLNSTTAAVTQIVSSATNVTLLASNTARRGASIYNDSVKKLYVKLGATASLTSYTKQLDVDEYWEIPFGYTGQIDGLWTLANGNAYVTELT